MKCDPSPSVYRYDAGTCSRSGSLNLSLALNVLSNTALVSRFRIFNRTSVCAPLAVGVETSASRHTYGVFSSSKNVLRFTSMASISAAIIPQQFLPEISNRARPDRHRVSRIESFLEYQVSV